VAADGTYATPLLSVLGVWTLLLSAARSDRAPDPVWLTRWPVAAKTLRGAARALRPCWPDGEAPVGGRLRDRVREGVERALGWADPLLEEVAAALLGPASQLRQRSLGELPPLALAAELDPLLLGLAYEQLVDGDRGRDVTARRRGKGAAKESGRYYTPPSLLRLGARLAIGSHGGGAGEAVVAVPRVLDPAMGCGGFLCEALDALVERAAWLARRSSGARDGAPAPSVDAQPSSVAARCLYGVDNDAAAVSLARAILWLRLGAPDTTLAEVGRGLRWGDALGGGPPAPPSGARAGEERATAEGALDRAPHGDSADAPGVMWSTWLGRLWPGEDPSDFGFDVVLGNPPYVGESGHRAALRRVRRSWVGKRADGKADLWHFFALLAGHLLAPGGAHLFVVPTYWRTATGAAAVRRLLLGELALGHLVDLEGQRPFSRAPGHHTSLYLAHRPGVASVERARPAWTRIPAAAGTSGFAGLQRALVRAMGEGAERLDIVAAPDGDLRVVPQRLGGLRERMLAAANGVRLGRGSLRQGIVANPARVRGPDGQEGVFVLTPGEVTALGPLTPEEQSCLVPFVGPAQVPAVGPPPAPERWLLYLANGSSPPPERLPTILRHLARWEPRLRERREVRTGRMQWYELHWPRRRELFERPALILPRQCLRPRCWPSPGGVFVDLGCNLLPARVAREQTGWEPAALAALLCSAPVRLWLAAFGKRKGRVFQLDQGPLRELPVPRPTATVQRRLAAAAGAVVGGADATEAWGEIDRAAADAYGVSPGEVRALLAWVG